MYETTKPMASSLHERAYRIVLYSAGEMCMGPRRPRGLVYTFIPHYKLLCILQDQMRTLQCGRNVYETITGCVHSRGHIPDRDIYRGIYGMMRRWSGRCGVKAPVFADVARGQQSMLNTIALYYYQRSSKLQLRYEILENKL